MNLHLLYSLIVTLFVKLDIGSCNTMVESSNDVLYRLVTKVDNLSNSVQNLLKTTHRLKRDKGKLKKKTESLSSSVEYLLNTTNSLNEDNEKLKTENQQLVSSVNQLNHETSTLKGANQQLSNKLEEMEEVSKRSAFSARMNTGSLYPRNDNPVIVPFKGVDLNLGGNYNSRTSTYTCPMNGIYFFTYSIFSELIKETWPGRDRAHAYLMLNNREINEIYCATDTEVYIRCHATNSIAIQCNKGNTVNVKTHGNRVRIHGDSSVWKATTFTGFLIHAL